MLVLDVGGLTAAEPRKVTTVEGITEYALDNGLKVLLFPDPSRPTVTVNMTVLVGSRHTAESLWEVLDDDALPDRTRLGPPGVDADDFVPLAPADARKRAQLGEKLLVDAGSDQTGIAVNGSVNNYLEINVQNSSNGTLASSDIVATANNGSASTVYVDLGINSAGYSNFGSNIFLPNTPPYRTKDFGFDLGSGQRTKVGIATFLVSYEWKPNLFFEGNAVIRKQTDTNNSLPGGDTFIISAGIRWNMNRREFDF